MTEKIEKDQDSIRKKDHIDLAFNSQTFPSLADPRFYYEPLLAPNQSTATPPEINFLGKKLNAPLWISSMTGGTKYAEKINRNIAKVCKEYQIGMGLGSCRQLLANDDHFKDFNIRKYCGDSVPLFANLGIAQLESLCLNKKLSKLTELVEKLQADGLIIHVNPLQEWLQPEGDRYVTGPLETIDKVLAEVNFPIIVKEVGQGMGPQSLRELLKRPLGAIEFASFGGTNFSKVECARITDSAHKEVKRKFVEIGHTATEMVVYANEALKELGNEVLCKNIIISGGIESALDGLYLTERLAFNNVYGIASRALKYALKSEQELSQFIKLEIEAYYMAKRLLKVKG